MMDGDSAHGDAPSNDHATEAAGRSGPNDQGHDLTMRSPDDGLAVATVADAVGNPDALIEQAQADGDDLSHWKADADANREAHHDTPTITGDGTHTYDERAATLPDDAGRHHGPGEALVRTDAEVAADPAGAVEDLFRRQRAVGHHRRSENGEPHVIRRTTPGTRDFSKQTGETVDEIFGEIAEQRRHTRTAAAIRLLNRLATDSLHDEADDDTDTTPDADSPFAGAWDGAATDPDATTPYTSDDTDSSGDTDTDTAPIRRARRSRAALAGSDDAGTTPAHPDYDHGPDGHTLPEHDPECSPREARHDPYADTDPQRDLAPDTLAKVNDLTTDLHDRFGGRSDALSRSWINTALAREVATGSTLLTAMESVINTIQSREGFTVTDISDINPYGEWRQTVEVEVTHLHDLPAGNAFQAGFLEGTDGGFARFAFWQKSRLSGRGVTNDPMPALREGDTVRLENVGVDIFKGDLSFAILPESTITVQERGDGPSPTKMMDSPEPNVALHSRECDRPEWADRDGTAITLGWDDDTKLDDITA
ncbi:hypothetical protein RYH80_18805 [Halobaculum sp. MBLA0147]|uniref:hypothetical protein n=1 Tax=Halobaculum sp. MBLA0147 TaxID=3079934 RepID=UPI0035266489